MAIWQLQTAKARLSELLRKVREEGPQTISVRGKEEFVVSIKGEAGVNASPPRTPRTWEELSALADGAGDILVLPPREPESLRGFDLAELVAEWERDTDGKE